MCLKDVRLEAGISQVKLSEKSGVSIWSIRDYEQKKRDINKSSVKTLYNLCVALNCDISDIISDQRVIDKFRMTRGQRMGYNVLTSTKNI